ncbi:hypothetical protein BJ170DRAFT_734561 [Xylariales sp. AK1849]|nr:hypothetical protein BJ170DRAFT_734561 [Xylariales sp. AK1849]
MKNSVNDKANGKTAIDSRVVLLHQSFQYTVGSSERSENGLRLDCPDLSPGVKGSDLIAKLQRRPSQNLKKKCKAFEDNARSTPLRIGIETIRLSAIQLKWIGFETYNSPSATPKLKRCPAFFSGNASIRYSQEKTVFKIEMDDQAARNWVAAIVGDSDLPPNDLAAFISGLGDKYARRLFECLNDNDGLLAADNAGVVSNQSDQYQNSFFQS